MTRTFVFGDPHFGQESLYIFKEKYGNILRPEFGCAEECDNQIIENCNKIIPEYNSQLYILGDLARNTTSLEKYIPQLNGQNKYLIMGNHDCKYPTYKLQNLFDKILGVTYFQKGNKKYIFTHVPIHIAELRNCINVHGHVHRNTLQQNIEDYSGVLLAKFNDDRYVNACLEPNNYFPIEIKDDGDLIYHGKT